VSVCQSVRLSQLKPVLYRKDLTNGAGYWRGGFFPHCVVRKFGYRKNVEVCPKLWTRKISPRHGTSIALSTKLVVVDDSRACSACWRHLHVHASRRVVAAYYKSVTSISTGFCCTTCFHGRQDFHRQRVARSVCASTASCSYILAVPRHRARSLIKPRNDHCSMREGQISRDQTSIFAV